MRVWKVAGVRRAFLCRWLGLCVFRRSLIDIVKDLHNHTVERHNALHARVGVLEAALAVEQEKAAAGLEAEVDSFLDTGGKG
jgi:hypothetical protein